MGRYVIERNFGAISDDDMLAAAVRSDAMASERFPEIVWEHSHIVAGDDGEILTFCVYAAPSEEMIHEHALAFGSHTITRIYELLDDVTPVEIRRRAANGLATSGS
jgi:Nickel responsive protein SCO4226-like